MDIEISTLTGLKALAGTAWDLVLARYFSQVKALTSCQSGNQRVTYRCNITIVKSKLSSCFLCLIIKFEQ